MRKLQSERIYGRGRSIVRVARLRVEVGRFAGLWDVASGGRLETTRSVSGFFVNEVIPICSVVTPGLPRNFM